MVRGDFCASAFSPPLDETRSEVRYVGRSENASPATGSGKCHQEQVEIINDALTAGAISQTYKVRVVARRRKLGSASARRQTVHDVRFFVFFLAEDKRDTEAQPYIMYGLGAKRALGRPQKPMVCPTCQAASPGCNETPDSRYAQPAGPRCGTKHGGT